MVKIEKADCRPVCPYCERKLEKLVEAKKKWYQSQRVVCCPHCHKILGITDRH